MTHTIPCSYCEDEIKSSEKVWNDRVEGYVCKSCSDFLEDDSNR
jgi:hypothetical protein